MEYPSQEEHDHFEGSMDQSIPQEEEDYTQRRLREFNKMTDTSLLPDKISGANAWLKEHTEEHLFDNDIYGEPMFDLSVEKVEAFLSTSIAQAKLEVVKAMMMKGRESKMTPFQTTVNQYLRNRAEEIGIDISSLDKQ